MVFRSFLFSEELHIRWYEAPFSCFDINADINVDINGKREISFEKRTFYFALNEVLCSVFEVGSERLCRYYDEVVIPRRAGSDRGVTWHIYHDNQRFGRGFHNGKWKTPLYTLFPLSKLKVRTAKLLFLLLSWL